MHGGRAGWSRRGGGEGLRPGEQPVQALAGRGAPDRGAGEGRKTAGPERAAHGDVRGGSVSLLFFFFLFMQNLRPPRACSVIFLVRHRETVGHCRRGRGLRGGRGWSTGKGCGIGVPPGPSSSLPPSTPASEAAALTDAPLSRLVPFFTALVEMARVCTCACVCESIPVRPRVNICGLDQSWAVDSDRSLRCRGPRVTLPWLVDRRGLQAL